MSGNVSKHLYESSESYITWCRAVKMEDSHGKEIVTRQLNNCDKVSASLFFFFFKWFSVTSTVQSSFANAPRDLTTAGSLTSEHCFPLHKKAFPLAQHSPVLYSSAHLWSRMTNNQADKHDALVVLEHHIVLNQPTFNNVLLLGNKWTYFKSVFSPCLVPPCKCPA